MSEASSRAGEDVFDRLRRARVTTNSSTRGASRGTSAPIITSSSSSRTRSAIIDDLIAHFDEPFGDSSAIPTWYVSEMARRHVTVVLSGDGGDELFGGYDRYLAASARRGIRSLGAAGAAGRVAALVLAAAAARRARQEFSASRRARRARPLSRSRSATSSADEKPALLSGDVRRAIGTADAEARLGASFRTIRGLPWPSQMMHFDFETYLPEDILTKVDRMSMAHSIESRVPLLDNQRGRFRRGDSRDSQDQERPQETHPQGGRVKPAAAARS